MRPLKIWYGSQSYESHARVAAVYRRIIQSRYDLVSHIKDADVVVLHYEPHAYKDFFVDIPSIKSKYIIGYCTWEASDLPDLYKQSLSDLDEIWTCSEYCASIYRRYHPNVIRIPHVIERDMRFKEADDDLIKRIVGHTVDNIYYLTIARLWDRRKNAATVIDTFCNLREQIPNARILIKCSPDDEIPRNEPHVIYLPINLSNSQINVLYDISHTYISAHHSEGWGLTMSDAMLFEKPVIATGYSGNLDYMDGTTAFLLDYEERGIEKEDCYGHFDKEMKWAYPDTNQLAETILQIYHGKQNRTISSKVTAASNAILQFRQNSVENLLYSQIDNISGHLQIRMTAPH